MSEPLPKELASLFEAERGSTVVDVASQAGVRSKIASTVGHTALGAGGGVLGGAGKVIAILAVVVGAGGIAYLIGRDEPRRPVTPTVEVARTSELASPSEVAPPNAVAQPEIARPSEPEGARPSAAAEAVARSSAIVEPEADAPKRGRVAPIARTAGDAPRARRSSAASEPSQAELVREAWAAVATGEPARALELAERDRDLHLDGPLAEEREALAVQALANLDRDDEAREAATRFLAQHRDSIHRVRIERVVRMLDARPPKEVP